MRSSLRRSPALQPGPAAVGGFESTRNAATSSTARPTAALAARGSRTRGAHVGALEARLDDEVVEAAPGERDGDERELHDQHVPVAGRPQVVERRQPQHAEVDPGGEQRGDQHRREPGEAEERRPRSAGAVRKTASSMTSPPTQSDAAERCTQSASSDHFDAGGSTAECPESERPDARPSESASAGQRKRARPVGQPAEEDERGDDREAERHHDEGLPKRVSSANGDRSP